ncbi:radical SAM family heme chaperone HemW [Falsiruegeria mediterranea]|uniref:Heme chaperone HemW n=1 Tax=Falsiruegeria mediterranea M17 TaxID=1200281 RepID=A0A2R8C3P0_9RHOB|nr:radical SAM family heme chaperone HemW [Falsiruegeria mediterranea]SPJ27022.1 Oxygen-independent coproporphyrinogen-III oxidase-like protein YqeR [Falsiruegeria mediterranea M17]
MADDWQNGGFGLYVHWPFCEAKCPYCDFNSHVSRQIDQSAWVDAYLLELERYAVQTPGRVLNTIFFGGGTPSLMAPETVDAVIQAARGHWHAANDMEITLEANPGSVEAGRFAGYRDAGVNRISMGIQALNDEDLRRLGRIHTVAEAQKAFDVARNCFDRVSFDLIYARQHQSLSEWRAELKQALSMAIDHLSLYQLTIEQGTAFGDRYAVGKLRGLPEDDTSADMYMATQEICEAAGLPAYEISNHAKPGSESQHNQVYWRYGDYVGIGPGAHGRLTIKGSKFATESYLNPNMWLAQVGKTTGESVRTSLSIQDHANEYLMMGLRLVQGIDMDRFQALSSTSIPQDRLDYLKEIGMVEQTGSILRATKDGRAVLNAVIREMLVD